MKTYSRKQPARPGDPAAAPIPLVEERPRKTRITDYFFKRIDGDEAECGTGAPSRLCNAKTSNHPYNAKTSNHPHNAKTPNNLPHSAKTPRLEQTFLDLGQKGLFMTECPECGLCYDRSFEQDTRRHEIEHRRRLFQHFDAAKYRRLAGWTELLPSGDAILRLAHGAATADLLGDVNERMDAVPIALDGSTRMTLYLYAAAAGDRIVGVLLVEAVADGKSFAGAKPARLCAAAVGVSRIWTDPACRRKGIAMKLLRAIRRCGHESSGQCAEHCRVPPELIAFSQPTTEGKALARRFLDDPQTDYICYTDK